MIIDTGEMDCDSLQLFLAPYLNGGSTYWCVAINGMDYEVRRVGRAGIMVRTLDQETAEGVGESALIEWVNINTLKIY